MDSAPQPAADPELHASALPRVLGSYRLVRLLGEGSSGRVYLAERIHFAQRVAVKCFYSGFVAAGAGADAARERDLLTQLDHPHIVRLIDHDTAPGGAPYLVMEYVDGLPLDRFADTNRLTLTGRVKLLLPVLEAVEYAHRHLVVHGDLKPANVLVGPEGEAKLLDFGSAAAAGDQTTSMTMSYASPEQKMGGPVTVGGDVYSLGLMARELLAGIPPARDPGLSPRLALRDAVDAPAIAAARATTLPRLLAGLTGNLEAILGMALAHEPERRYLSVGDLRADLERHLAGLPIGARRVGGTERAWLWVGRHKLAAAMAALLVLVIAGSSAGVAVKAAEAAHQRHVAETRLADLVRLNGALDGELYRSLAGLQGSDAARHSLLTGATETLQSVSASGVQNSQLALELATQFEQVANLELAQGAVPEARANAARGLEVLRRANRSPAAKAEMQRLEKLAHP